MKLYLVSACICQLVYNCFGDSSRNIYVDNQDTDETFLTRLYQEDEDIFGRSSDLMQMSLHLTTAPKASSRTSPSPSFKVSVPPIITIITSSPTLSESSPHAKSTTTPSTRSPSVPTTSSLSPTAISSVLPQQELCSLKLDLECYRITNGTQQLCSDIATVSSPSDCFQNVDFEYTVTNNCLEIGCTDVVIVSLEAQRDGNTTNLTSMVPESQVVSPGQSLTTTETLTLNFCIARQFNVTSSVVASTNNTVNPTFCAADNMTTVVIQNALAPLQSDAHIPRFTAIIHTFLAILGGFLLF